MIVYKRIYLCNAYVNQGCNVSCVRISFNFLPFSQVPFCVRKLPSPEGTEGTTSFRHDFNLELLFWICRIHAFAFLSRNFPSTMKHKRGTNQVLLLCWCPLLFFRSDTITARSLRRLSISQASGDQLWENIKLQLRPLVTNGYYYCPSCRAELINRTVLANARYPTHHTSTPGSYRGVRSLDTPNEAHSRPV